MEYVEGRTLRDVLKTEGRLPPRRALEIVAEVCGALDFSHRNGIVHRDIKPANVMITAAGAVKVMDFGIARALSDNAATVTQTAAVIGTAQYLSPEQARGESVDARSDVYSTGCLLYELRHRPSAVHRRLAGRGRLPARAGERRRRRRRVNPAVPRALDSIVMKALAKNPLNRYQSAGEMRADLQRALADRPVEAEAVLTDAERTQFIAASGAVAGRPADVRGPRQTDAGRADAGRASRTTGGPPDRVVVVRGRAAAGDRPLWRTSIVFAGNDKPKLVGVPNLIGQPEPRRTTPCCSRGSSRPPVSTRPPTSAASIRPTPPRRSPSATSAPRSRRRTRRPRGHAITYTVYAVPDGGGAVGDRQDAVGRDQRAPAAGPDRGRDDRGQPGRRRPGGRAEPGGQHRGAVRVDGHLQVSTGKVAMPSMVGKSFQTRGNS